MARAQGADGGTAPNKEVAANILNTQSRAADKRWSSSMGLVGVLTTPHHKNISCYKMFTQKASDLD